MVTRMVTRYTALTMPKVPSPAEAAERWDQLTVQWALRRAAQGLLVHPLPPALWVFNPHLRKISRRAGKTATISLGQEHLQHLGMQIGEHALLIPRKDGTLTLRKATAKDLRQANPYTRLTVIPTKKGKKVAS